MQVIFVFLLFFQLIFVPSLYSADHVHKISIPCADDVYKLSQGTISGLFKSKNDKFIKNLAACCVKKESNSILGTIFSYIINNPKNRWIKPYEIM